MFVKKLDRSIAGEIFTLSCVIMAALSSVLFMFRLLGFAQYIFISQEGAMALVMFVVFLLPNIFKLTVPISILLATTITIIRMANDRELEAWLASGVSAARLAVAPFAIGCVVMFVSLGSSLYLEPFARQEFRKFKWMHARRSVESLIENRLHEKTFLSELFRAGDTDISFYVDKLSSNRKDFKGVFLAVTRKQEHFSFVLVADAGSLKKESRGGFPDYVFTLQNGRLYSPIARKEKLSELIMRAPELFDISELKSLKGEPLVVPKRVHSDLPTTVPSPDSVGIGQVGSIPTPSPELAESVDGLYPPGAEWSVVEFGEMKVSLVNMFQKQFDPGNFDANDIRSQYPAEYIAELRSIRKKPDWGSNQRSVRDHTYFYEQIVVPISCLFLPVVGLCLGMQDPRRKAGVAYVGLGLAIFFYYASIMLCQQLALRFIASPEVSLWLPPLILLALTLFLLRWRTSFPPSTGFFEYCKLMCKSCLRPFVLAKRAVRRKS